MPTEQAASSTVNHAGPQNGLNGFPFPDRNGEVHFHEETKRFLAYFGFDLLTNLVAIVLLLGLVAPGRIQLSGLLGLLFLTTFFTYLFGAYENFFNPTYGITLETQFVFFWVLISIYFSGMLMPIQMPGVPFWIAFWVYLNLLSPYLSLVIRRIYPFRAVFVNHQFVPAYRRRLDFWGLRVEAVVEQDNLIEWLCNNSSANHFVKGYDVILIQTKNLDGLTRTLAEEFFVRFALLRSINRLAFVFNNHIQPIVTHPLVGVNRRLKRMIDFLVSSIALLILFPLLALIIVAIKVDSPGSIFFAQKRPSKFLKYFKLLKFRTMYRDAEERLVDLLASDSTLRQEFETTFKLKDDPRITKVGKVLRKLSLDEIPQLINVLKGEMSLVGYRPILVDEIRKRLEKTPLIFHVLPGATGKWQISGRSDMDYEERMLMDLSYIHNWSFLEDLRILLKTPKALLSKKGAY